MLLAHRLSCRPDGLLQLDPSAMCHTVNVQGDVDPRIVKTRLALHYNCPPSHLDGPNLTVIQNNASLVTFLKSEWTGKVAKSELMA
jgi:hypothetical protein